MQKQYEKEWPPELPERLSRRLEQLAATIAQARSMQDTLFHSNMKKDAKSIAAAAAKLLEKVREFSKNYGVSMYENYRTSAIESIKDDFGEMRDDELLRFRCGMDDMSLQQPLLGLRAYMLVLAAIPGKAGPRGSHLERYAVQETVKEFERHGMSTSFSDDSTLLKACIAVLERSGKQTTEEALAHYLRQINGAKT